MTLTHRELAHLLEILKPYRAEPLSKSTISLALRLVREVAK